MIMYRTDSVLEIWIQFWKAFREDYGHCLRRVGVAANSLIYAHHWRFYLDQKPIMIPCFFDFAIAIVICDNKSSNLMVVCT